MTPGDGPTLGVVIPTLDEVRHLPHLLDDLAALRAPHQVVVSDGGSVDGTRDRARDAGARVIRAPRGRASQLNAGARALDAPWLLFLHADVRLPADARRALETWLDRAGTDEAAHFGFRLAGDDWFWRFIELGQGIRERLYGLVYGDQGLLVAGEAFRAVGGYPSQPLMEDVEILRRLRGRVRIRRLDADLVSSPRRYEREGRWRGWLRNTALITLYLAGVPARRLARWYPDAPDTGWAEPDRAGDGPSTPHERRTLLIFAKAPEPGRVKTRLARGVGDEAAARFYRELGRRVVDQVRDGPYRTVVCYDPPDAEARMRAWLGTSGLEFRPQGGGDLGDRMGRAVAEALTGPGQERRAGAACVVGTDAPDVDRAVVTEAFRALEGADVVLGPAADGGYYLVGLRTPRPELFRGVPWSTSRVLETTLKRARERGLRVTLLDERADVDTAEDLDPSTRARLRGGRRS